MFTPVLCILKANARRSAAGLLPVYIRRFVLDMLILHDFWAFVLYNRSTMVYVNAMFFVWNCRFFELL